MVEGRYQDPMWEERQYTIAQTWNTAKVFLLHLVVPQNLRRPFSVIVVFYLQGWQGLKEGPLKWSLRGHCYLELADPSPVSGHLRSPLVCNPFSTHFPLRRWNSTMFNREGELWGQRASVHILAPLPTGCRSWWVVHPLSLDLNFMICKMGMAPASPSWTRWCTHVLGHSHHSINVSSEIMTLTCQRILWGPKNLPLSCKLDLFLSSWWGPGTSWRRRVETLGSCLSPLVFLFGPQLPHMWDGNINNICLSLPRDICSSLKIMYMMAL